MITLNIEHSLYRKRPIGIFDSGIGGLTVLKEIRRIMPNENTIYLGDTARVPYGTKSPSTVIKYSTENTLFLTSHHIKMLIVACNTSSSYSIEHLRETFKLPVLGVIEPGAKRACEATRTKVVGIIGTEGTVNSGAYERALGNIDSGIRCVKKACPLFVPLAEEGWWDHPVTEEITEIYLKGMMSKGVDTIILGCTHYPLLKGIIRKVVGEQIRLIDSARAVSEDALGLLTENDILNIRPDSTTHEIYVTDTPRRFVQVGGRFFGKRLKGVKRVQIT